MNPKVEAIPFIEDRSAAYHISWRNNNRVSGDWKVKLYQQAGTGRQLAIYDRKTTVIRLEHMVAGVRGIAQLPECPASHALDVSFSRFKGGAGVCVSVDSVNALKGLLDTYFSEAPSAETAEELSSAFEREVAEAQKRSRFERLARLATASKKARKVLVQTTAFERNPDVVAEVLERARGKCEACNAPAPFHRARTGEPYLEVHHVISLASDGDDSVENALALCPNCHRKSHYG